jgi:hypothetical protein
MKTQQFDYYTIRIMRDYPEAPARWVVHGFGIYDDNSVLAGQSRKVFIDSFDTEKEAVDAYGKSPYDAGMSHDSFDPIVSFDHLGDSDY